MKNILAVVCILVFAGCYNDKASLLYPNVTGGCDTSNITYSADIVPILNKSCALSGCHDAATPSAEYDLTIYDGAKKAVDRARLIGAITHQDGFSAMPKGGGSGLVDCDIYKIMRWVNQGAANN